MKTVSSADKKTVKGKAKKATALSFDMFADFDFGQKEDRASKLNSRAEKEDFAIEVVINLLNRGRKLLIAYSGGKDSSVLLNLTLLAAIKAKALGYIFPPLVISHGVTQMDNPQVANNALVDMNLAVAFAKKHGVDVVIDIAKPSVSSEFWVRIIAGGSLPRFPGDGHDCTITLKLQPMNRSRRNLLGTLSTTPPLTLIGTRFEESAQRMALMQARGERADEPWMNDDGDQMLSLIGYFDEMDVWAHVRDVMDGKTLGFSDFKEMWDIYSAAGAGGSCAIVGATATEALKQRPCSARTGCTACTLIGPEDKSLSGMIESDFEKYGFMKPLNDIRNFLFHTRWDLNRRQWLGRTIKNGYVAVRPDVYGPNMQRELLQYCLTAQIDEMILANSKNIAPRFTVLSMEALITIDIYWSLYGQQDRPFEVWAILEDIMRGARYYPPADLNKDSFPRVPFPKTRVIKVGEDWDAGLNSSQRMFTGLRDPMRELANELPDDIKIHRANQLPHKIAAEHIKDLEKSGALSKRELADGRTVTNIPTKDVFTVDPDAAAEFMDFAFDTVLEHRAAGFNSSYAYTWYAQMGIFSLSPGTINGQDITMRRTRWRQRNNLIGSYSLEHLFSLCEDDSKISDKIIADFSKPDKDEMVDLVDFPEM